MNEKKEQKSSVDFSMEYKVGAFLISTFAAYGLMRKGNYRIALSFYPNAGGGGLNLYKQPIEGQSRRIFGIDYHPFWNKELRQKEWKLHYHRGDNKEEIRKHRPYDGW